MTRDEIDLLYNNDAVCPYCGATNTDTWEAFWEADVVDGAEVNFTCGGCNKEFVVIQNVQITYSSRPAKA